MKILQITPVFYPALKRGGIVAAVYNLSKELVKMGCDISVYTTDNLDGDTRISERYIEIENIKISYFRNLSNKLAWGNIFLPFGMFLTIIKTTRNFDLVHLQDYRFIPHIAVYICNKIYQIPYIYQPRYSYSTFFQKPILKRLFDITFGHRILLGAAMVIAQLPSEAKEYEYLGVKNSKIAVIPNGFDMHELRELPEKCVFRAKYGIDSTCKIVLYLGRIDRIKGIDLLVESFAEIAKIMDNILLIIVGPDAGYLPEVKARICDLGIGENVLQLGPLFNKDKLEAYVDADVYIMPSMYEGLSIAPLEAYACNTPVIMTDRCGTAQWMSDEFEYIIPYDKERMVQVIIQSLSNVNSQVHSEHERVRRLNLLHERFSWAQIGKHTVQIYCDIVNLYK